MEVSEEVNYLVVLLQLGRRLAPEVEPEKAR